MEAKHRDDSGAPSRCNDEQLAAEFRTHYAALTRYVQRRAHPVDVGDIVSETFASAITSWKTIPPEPLPWLYRTASNHILHFQRSAARRSALGDRLMRTPDVEKTSSSEGLFEANETSDLVQLALRELSDSDQEMLRLWAWEQLSTDQIAVALGIRPNAARVRLHRAQRRLGKAIAVIETETRKTPETQAIRAMHTLEAK